MELRFTKLQDFIDALIDILDKHEKYVKDNIDESDFAVRNQHCLLYKWFCEKWYGHIFKKDADYGTCLRCGKKVLPLKSTV